MDANNYKDYVLSLLFSKYIAEKCDVPSSWVIRQAIHRFVQEHGAHPELPLRLSGKEGQK